METIFLTLASILVFLLGLAFLYLIIYAIIGSWKYFDDI